MFYRTGKRSSPPARAFLNGCLSRVEGRACASNLKEQKHISDSAAIYSSNRVRIELRGLLGGHPPKQDAKKAWSVRTVATFTVPVRYLGGNSEL
jgi:hypothetical protein